VRISSVRLTNFKRFANLKIEGIPHSAKLVILAGPNGCGKSSLFDALNLRYQLDSGKGWAGDNGYYSRGGRGQASDVHNGVEVNFHDGKFKEGALYVRSAYRNDPEFRLDSLRRFSPAKSEVRFRRMIEQDAVVSQNYQRLASQALEAVFQNEREETTIGLFREKTIGAIRAPMQRLFPDLVLNSLGSPLEEGTFKFDKGQVSHFEYQNLSGGEKAAFDLILDIIIKGPSFADAIYCIDEPEAHMNTRLQGALLEELCNLVPEQGQLWVATHSIGMMRKARELASKYPEAVAFLNFEGHDFDKAATIVPAPPNRALWESVLRVALDDLASLVTPREVAICEGVPANSPAGKNAEHDAQCYNAIFEAEFPDVKFIAGGNASDVGTDRLGFLAVLPKIASGIKVRRLIDRDDRSPSEVAELVKKGIFVLNRRNIEGYLFDDEILIALCKSVGKAEEAANLLSDKHSALQESINRGNAPDDLKSAAGQIYNCAKARLALTAVGNDHRAFARHTLAPLVTPETSIYGELRRSIFPE